jgi:hypothetical protein
VYYNHLANVKRQIQQAENLNPVMAISLDVAPVHNASIYDNLTSELALEQRAIRSTETDIPIDINCMDDEQHFGMPGHRWD